MILLSACIPPKIISAKLIKFWKCVKTTEIFFSSLHSTISSYCRAGRHLPQNWRGSASAKCLQNRYFLVSLLSGYPNLNVHDISLWNSVNKKRKGYKISWKNSSIRESNPSKKRTLHQRKIFSKDIRRDSKIFDMSRKRKWRWKWSLNEVYV